MQMALNIVRIFMIFFILENMEDLKISALEQAEKLGADENNELHEIKRLISNMANWRCFQSGQKPGWMSESTYKFSCDFQADAYKSADEALKTEQMKKASELPLCLELKSSNFDED